VTIAYLIDKQDNFEIVRDRLAVLLANEVAAQKNLATLASKDPSLWDMRIYSERVSPWENISEENHTPIVNISYDSSNFQESVGSTIHKQKADATYFIDCYGYGQSREDDDGHLPADQSASLDVHRVLRLCRNIIMASENAYLGLRGLVWRRWPENIKIYQPDSENITLFRVVAGRITLHVEFLEEAPQADESNLLEYVGAGIKRAEDGSILADVHFEYPQE
jgi:hypothetical protein